MTVLYFLTVQFYRIQKCRGCSTYIQNIPTNGGIYLNGVIVKTILSERLRTLVTDDAILQSDQKNAYVVWCTVKYRQN